MRYYILLFILFSVSYTGYAQQTVNLSDTYSPDVTEKYQVLKTNHDIKQGVYQAFYKKKIVVASGVYTQGKRTGVWHFYDVKGNLTQHYNYDQKHFVYATREDTAGNIIKYEFIPKTNDTDMVRIPLRIGGIFYGYLPYIKMFKVQDAGLYNPGSVYGVLQFLVSPNGRLAECKLLVKTRTYVNAQPQETTTDSYSLDNDLLTEEDKQFLPAMVNHNNVSSTIYVFCNINSNGSISIY